MIFLSVPSLGPINVEANATSSTTILVRWGDVPVEHQNGQIEGFKVYYGANSRSTFQYKNIPSNTTFTTTLTELRKFVQYHVQVLAYTRLGDGALSIPPVRVQTFEDSKWILKSFQTKDRDKMSPITHSNDIIIIIYIKRIVLYINEMQRIVKLKIMTIYDSVLCHSSWSTV